MPLGALAHRVCSKKSTKLIVEGSVFLNFLGRERMHEGFPVLQQVKNVPAVKKRMLYLVPQFHDFQIYSQQAVNLIYAMTSGST